VFVEAIALFWGQKPGFFGGARNPVFSKNRVSNSLDAGAIAPSKEKRLNWNKALGEHRSHWKGGNRTMKPIKLTPATESLSKHIQTFDADVESVSLSNNPRFLEIIDRSREQQKTGKVTSSEEVRKKLGLG
jgi:hypothetical protein